jgi:hypothetical protein
METLGLIWNNGEPIKPRPTATAEDFVEAVRDSWSFFADIFEEWKSEKIIDFENQVSKILGGIDRSKNYFQTAKILEASFGFTAKTDIIDAVADFYDSLDLILENKSKDWAANFRIGYLSLSDGFVPAEPGDIYFLTTGKIPVQVVSIRPRRARVVVRRLDDVDFFPWGDWSPEPGYIVNAEDLSRSRPICDSSEWLRSEKSS